MTMVVCIQRGTGMPDSVMKEGRGTKILLIEDVDVMREYLRIYFASHYTRKISANASRVIHSSNASI